MIVDFYATIDGQLRKQCPKSSLETYSGIGKHYFISRSSSKQCGYPAAGTV
jgi:hypothetical protein